MVKQFGTVFFETLRTFTYSNKVSRWRGFGMFANCETANMTNR